MYMTFALTVMAVTPMAAKPTSGIPEAMAECKNKAVDLFFLLDSSSSVLPTNYKKMLDFVADFVKKLDIGPSHTQVGLGVFSDNFKNEFDMNRYRDKASLLGAISKVRYYGGSTYTGKGLRGMTSGFRRSGTRPNVTKIGIVVADGRSRHRTATVAAADEAREEGIKLFAVGIGSGLDNEELATFSSEPQREFMKHVRSFDALRSEVDGLARKACSLKPPRPDNATCGSKEKADIIFIYNAAKMSAENVARVNHFTGQVVDSFSMTSGNVRVGVISEGRQGEDINLSEYVRKTDLVSALREQRTPQLAPLLRKVRLQGFEQGHGGRRDAKKIAIIFYDDTVISTDAMLEAWKMTYDDIKISVIRVGDFKPDGSGSHLASSRELVISVPSYDKLEENLDSFLKKLCTSNYVN